LRKLSHSSVTKTIDDRRLGRYLGLGCYNFLRLVKSEFQAIKKAEKSALIIRIGGAGGKRLTLSLWSTKIQLNQ
jgi:hypothetical protein